MFHSHIPTRRQFLASAGSAALASLGSAQAAKSTLPKVAAIVTTYHRYSHADNIVTRFMEGYSFLGNSYPPPGKLVSLADTIAGFKAICAGDYDHLPEASFYMVGGMDEAVEKAKRMAAEA